MNLLNGVCAADAVEALVENRIAILNIAKENQFHLICFHELPNCLEEGQRRPHLLALALAPALEAGEDGQYEL